MKVITQVNKKRASIKNGELVSPEARPQTATTVKKKRTKTPSDKKTASKPTLRELKKRANSSSMMSLGVKKAKPTGQIEVESENVEDKSVSD